MNKIIADLKAGQEIKLPLPDLEKFFKDLKRDTECHACELDYTEEGKVKIRKSRRKQDENINR